MAREFEESIKLTYTCGDDTYSVFMGKPEGCISLDDFWNWLTMAVPGIGFVGWEEYTK